MQLPIDYSTNFNNGYLNMLKKYLGIPDSKLNNIAHSPKEDIHKISLEPTGVNASLTPEE